MMLPVFNNEGILPDYIKCKKEGERGESQRKRISLENVGVM